MKKTQMRGVPSQELVKRYDELAAARGHEFELGHVKAANRIFDEQATITRELQRRGTDDLGLLLPLLGSSNPCVRLDSATIALFFAKAEAEPVLEELVTRQGSLGFTAKFTLKQWRKGELKPPWQWPQ